MNLVLRFGPGNQPAQAAFERRGFSVRSPPPARAVTDFFNIDLAIDAFDPAMNERLLEKLRMVTQIMIDAGVKTAELDVGIARGESPNPVSNIRLCPEILVCLADAHIHMCFSIYDF